MIQAIKIDFAKGLKFLNQITLDVNKKMGSDFTFIGKYSKVDEKIDTISLCSKKEIIANIRYDIDGTPCRYILKKKECIYIQNVQELFPKDQLLIDLGIANYVGFPLFSSTDSELIGIMVSLFKNKIKDSNKVIEHFKFLAPRVELELDRISLNSKLKNHFITIKNQNETLIKNEILLSKSQEVAHLGSFVFDIAKGVWESSKELNKIFGIDNKLLKPLDLWLKIIHPDDFAMMKNYLMVNVIQNSEKFDKKYRIKTIDTGEGKWVHGLGELKLNKSGEPIMLYGTIQDITKTKKTEQNLQESIKETIDIKNALDKTSIVAVTDTEGIIISVNDKFCKISQYTEKELVGNTHQLVNSGRHTNEFFKELWATITNGIIWRGDVKNKAKDGSYYWVDTTIIPTLNEKGRPVQYVSIRKNITQRKRAESLLAEQKKQTLQAQFKGEEREKNRISKDLHDGLGQILSAAKLSLTALWNKESIDENTRKQLKDIKLLLNKANDETRRISRNLLPRVLNDYGLIVAIEKLLEEVSVLKIETTFSASPNIRICEANEITTYRIIQESVNNAIKHSSCTEINVILTFENNENIFTVHNNGSPFNVNQLNEGFGVLNMIQRAESIDGTLNIISNQDTGTSVVFKHKCDR